LNYNILCIYQGSEAHVYYYVGGGDKQREEAVGEGVREKEWRRGMVGWKP